MEREREEGERKRERERKEMEDETGEERSQVNSKICTSQMTLMLHAMCGREKYIP